MKTKDVTLLNGNTVTVCEIVYGTYKETRESSESFDNDFALVLACSGLTEEQVEDLDAPDFNEILLAATELNDYEQAPAVGATTIPLSAPVTTIMGESITTAIISMPKVKHSRELAKLQDGFARIEYMIRSATGIHDLESMPMSDYTALVIAVPDFFGRGAGYFQKHK